MKRVIKFILLFNLFVLSRFCFGQNGAGDFVRSGGPESFRNLDDSLIRKEVAMYSLNGAAFAGDQSSGHFTLTEIPLRGCSAKSVRLNKGSTYINIFFKSTEDSLLRLPIYHLDSIFLVTHSHYWVEIPKSAYDGIFHNHTCELKMTGKKSQGSSPYFKAYQSGDKRRIYIYMQGGMAEGRYEVSWIFNESRYIGRTVDELK